MNKYLQAILAAGIIGAAGVSLIQTSEGYVPKTYRDPVGIPTSCWGHTGPDVRMGQTLTRDQCEALLGRDIVSHVQGVKSCVRVPLNVNQMDAVVSFTFNVGVNKFCNSTMARKLNARDYVGAAGEFPKWRYGTVNGRTVVLPGLVTRRAAEQRLFLTPVRP